MTTPPAAELLTIAPENLWVKVEGRCIGPITAPPGTEAFAREYRQLAAQITSQPVPPLRALDVGSLWELESDLRHVRKLLEMAQIAMEDADIPESREDVEALLSILRDRSEILTWKAGQLGNLYTRKEPAKVAP